MQKHMTAHIIFLIVCEEVQHPTQNLNVIDGVNQNLLDFNPI